MLLNNYPKLYFSEDTIQELICRLNGPFVIFLCDGHNYNLLSHYENVVLIVSCDNRAIEKLHLYDNCTTVVAVGWCTVLDIGRMYAKKQAAKLICIPTILSTVCMSNNLSKLVVDWKSKLFKTVAPYMVVVHMPSLLWMQNFEKIKWTQSGFWDLFSNISASIDYQYKQWDLSLWKIKKNVSNVFDALDWVNQNFKKYNRVCMEKLAVYIHESCLDVLKKNSNAFSSWWEHMFYYQIFDSVPINQQKATHGQIVWIGTLIMVKIYEKITWNSFLYENLREAFSKLSFPLTYNELEEINLWKKIIVDHLHKISPDKSLLRKYFVDNSYNLLDEIFM